MLVATRLAPAGQRTQTIGVQVGVKEVQRDFVIMQITREEGALLLRLLVKIPDILTTSVFVMLVSVVLRTLPRYFAVERSSCATYMETSHRHGDEGA